MENADRGGHGERRPGALGPGEELVRVRAGAWRLLVPMSGVERVLGAALPARPPTAGAAAPPLLAIGGELVPVVFAEALVGSDEVELAPEDQMLLLRHGERRALLWVDAVEDVVEHAPVAPPAPMNAAPGDLVCGWSGGERSLPVLDVPSLLSLV